MRVTLEVKSSLVLLLSICQFTLMGQVYLEKQSRHRFAQLSLGLDYEMGIGAKTEVYNLQANPLIANTVNINPSHTPRILIGGTHFWGHADFYIAIPLVTTQTTVAANTIRYQKGVETAFKYYPWRIRKEKLRPYLGFSLSSYSWQQNTQLGDDNAILNRRGVPILMGLTYQNRNYLWELGANWNASADQTYYLSPDKTVPVQGHPLYLTASFRYLLETTLGAEKDWESGRTEKVTEALAKAGKLDGFFVGAGFSSAFWIQQAESTAFSDAYGNYDNSVMPEFSAGYYFHKPDISVGLAYRGYKQSNAAFGWTREASRRSLALEATRTLFDYHGFVLFVGPFVSWERLSFESIRQGQVADDIQNDQLGYGICLGWDIRPNRIQTFLLRTNLRWTPNLNLPLGGDNRQEVFNSIEFNFIQLIIFPERLF